MLHLSDVFHSAYLQATDFLKLWARTPKMSAKRVWDFSLSHGFEMMFKPTKLDTLCTILGSGAQISKT